jgi:hypothetical protein
MKTTTQRNANRPATLRPCPKCKAPVITGWTEAPSLPATLDPHPLDTASEVACLLVLNRRTCDLTGQPGQWRIGSWRAWPGATHRRIGKPAGPILAEHKCGQGAPSIQQLQFEIDHTRPVFDGPPTF